MGLKHLFEKIEPHFTHGKLRKYYPLYEATATIFYTPGLVTKGRHTSAMLSTSNE